MVAEADLSAAEVPSSPAAGAVFCCFSSVWLGRSLPASTPYQRCDTKGLVSVAACVHLHLDAATCATKMLAGSA